MRKVYKAAALAPLLFSVAATAGPPPAPDLAALKPVTTVSDRYQAYNIEMVEVTGGRFWAPYGGPAGEVYRQRPPIDLTNPRLRGLARNLAPALVRVSGTWANNTYLEAAGEHLSAPPAGFVQVLTRAQWQNLVAFSRAVDAPIVTSFAASKGTRAPDGQWTPAQAQRLLDLTRAAGGSLYAAEFFNESNMPSAAPEMPADYTAVRYGADFRIFREWARKSAPEMKLLGVGGVGEGALNIPVNAMGHVSSDDMMRENPGSLDAVSYHFYGTVSQRCAHLKIGTAVRDEALTDQWLDRTLVDYRFYAALRDKYEPGKPLWNTETAQAACGGSPWASTFLDSFRYLNQLAVLAQQGVQVVMHNTLAASDYALIDRDTLEPRPNYWAAVLWRRVMGRTVLAAPAPPAPGVRLFAQCLRGTPGGVALLALNTGSSPARLRLAQPARAWTMTADPIDSRTVRINGAAPVVDSRGTIAPFRAARVASGLTLAPQSISFLAVPTAGNGACH